MKLVPVEKLDLTIRRAYTNNWKILNEFVEGDFDIVEVREFTNKDANSCAASLGASRKRYGFNVSVIKRGERVFLVKNK